MSRRNLLRPIGLLFLALICFLTAQGTGIRLFIHLFYLLIGLLLLSFVWAWLNVRGLRVLRETSLRRAQVGDTVIERLTVHNPWPWPRLWLELRDYSDLPQYGGGMVTYLPAFNRRRWSSRMVCTMRGRFTLGPATLASGDPFGIFLFERPCADTNELIVYPRTVDLRSFVLPGADLSGGQSLRGRGLQASPAIAGVREYTPGDPFSRIHWRTTARTGQLMVKEFELDPTAEIYVVLDMHDAVHGLMPGGSGLFQFGELRSVESTEEYAVEAAASITRHLLANGLSVGLLAWGQHLEIIPAEREPRQLIKILEALAVLRAHGYHPLAELLLAESQRFDRSSTLVIISSSPDIRWAESLQQLLHRGIRAAAVLLDAASFDGSESVERVQAQLTALRVPSYVLRQGQALVDRLQATGERRS